MRTKTLIIMFLFVELLTGGREVYSNELKARVAFQRGKVYLRTQQYDNAIKAFNEAIQLNNSYSEAYHQRGSAYYYLKQYPQACLDWKQACTLDLSCLGWNFGIYQNLCQTQK
ncbi:tetratricopeptide repeat protein [Deltaproteobacteria bacterium TL4]